MSPKNLRKIKEEIICPPKIGEIVEGKIVASEPNALFLDLGFQGIGIIYGRAFYEAKDILKNLKIGDKLSAKITSWKMKMVTGNCHQKRPQRNSTGKN